MASTIVFRRGSTFPSQGSGITLAEPVFNTSQNTFHIGLGHGVTAEWVGAPITGLSASIASGEAYKIPTAAAVKNYIGGLCFGNTAGGSAITQYVSSFNGLTGAVQGVSSAAAGTGISVSAATGAITITNTGVQSFNGTTGAVQGVSAAVAGTGISVSGTTGSVTITNTGVQSFNGTTGAVQGVRYVNGKTGDIVILGGTNIGVSTSGPIVTVNNEGVLSVDGSTGAVNNVARTNTANTFTQLQTFSNASGISASQVITKTVQLPGNQSNLTITGALFSDSAGIRLYSSDGLGGDYYTIVKGSVLSADRTITFPNTTGTVALTSQLMGAVNGSTAATTAVTSFNGSTGAVQGVSAAVAGTGISVSGTTGSVTITNTGVQSFNGLTGAVGGVTTSVANTFTALQSFSTGVSASGATFGSVYVSGGVTVGVLTVRTPATTRYMDFLPGSANKIVAKGNSTLNILQENYSSIFIGDAEASNNATYIEVEDSNQVIKFYYNGDSYTFPTASGSVGQVLGTTSVGSLSWVNSVQSFNGSTGPVGISAGTGISITQSGTTYTIASTGGGGSKTYERFTPLDNQPPTTNFATIDTRNGIAVLDFADSSADESAIFVGVIPEAASLGSGLKVRIIWMATSATSGSVRWGAQFMNLNTDLDSDSFDTATEGNGTANGTNGTPTTTELTVTNIDSLTAGDFFRLKIYREQSDTVNDTMTGDAELIAVEVRSAS